MKILRIALLSLLLLLMGQAGVFAQNAGTPTVDSDGDGLLDGIEILLGYNPDVADLVNEGGVSLRESGMASVALQFVAPSVTFGGSLTTEVGSTEGLTLNLRSLVAGTLGTGSWSFVPGQDIQDWVYLNSDGTLTVSGSSGATAGVKVAYV